MANKKAAMKDIKQSAKRRARNEKTDAEIKKLLKNIEKQLTADKLDEKIVAQAMKLIDRAVAKGRLKKNTAARKKSRLAKKVKKTVKK